MEKEFKSTNKQRDMHPLLFYVTAVPVTQYFKNS